jgi:hypothetical protein
MWEYLTCHPTVSAGSQEPNAAEKTQIESQSRTYTRTLENKDGKGKL